MIENAIDKELPTMMQALFVISWSDNRVARKENNRLVTKPMHTAEHAPFTVNPCLANGLTTIHINLSIAMTSAIVLDATTDVMIVAPAAKHVADSFHLRAT